MISDVTNAMARAIYQMFPQSTIYTEAVEQGLKEPCFFITCLLQLRKKRFDKMHCHSLPFVVQYHPRHGGDANAECNGVCEKLFTALEYIKLGDNPIRGVDMQGEIHDGVLSFSVTFGFNTYIKSEIPIMEIHKTETGIKEGNYGKGSRKDSGSS